MKIPMLTSGARRTRAQTRLVAGINTSDHACSCMTDDGVCYYAGKKTHSIDACTCAFELAMNENPNSSSYDVFRDDAYCRFIDSCPS
jgi:hypothetical protein